jgi:hypothetical protein
MRPARRVNPEIGFIFEAGKDFCCRRWVCLNIFTKYEKKEAPDVI